MARTARGAIISDQKTVFKSRRGEDEWPRGGFCVGWEKENFCGCVTFLRVGRPMEERRRKGVESFEAMFSRYFARVYRFLLRLTRSEDLAEELTQQTFFKALKEIDSFEGRSSPVTWLCSIAKNAYFDLCRREKREMPMPAEQGAGGADAEGEFLRRHEAMRIHRHLHALEEPYREVFTLRVFGELKYAQIASLFGRTEAWARIVYYRAKRELIERLEREEEAQ